MVEFVPQHVIVLIAQKALPQSAGEVATAFFDQVPGLCA